MVGDLQITYLVNPERDGSPLSCQHTAFSEETFSQRKRVSPIKGRRFIQIARSRDRRMTLRLVITFSGF